jgi:S-formylglutathione hydrolase FrmB
MVRIGCAIALGLAAVALPACGGSRDVRPDGAAVHDVEIESRNVPSPRRETVVVPAGGPRTGRSLLVFLHGRNNDERSNLDDEMFKALRALGDQAPVVAFPNGGDSSYWHDREGGQWGRYVLEDVIPQTERRFHTNGRVAIGGISMGGFGAYDLAIRSRRRFCAVGGHSPALWAEAGKTAEGAFDNADDFARHDVVGAAGAVPAKYAQQPLWLDAGTEDPFDPGDRAFVGALKATGVSVTVKRWPGGHERSYWKRHWGDYLRFYASALDRCPSGGG